MAAPRIDDIWRFWDYGSIQFVENRVTGEFLKVYGPDALFGDGPFKMVRHAAAGGRPILLGLDGTDLERALHLADEHASIRLLLNCGEKPGDESIVSVDTSDGPKSCRLRELQESAEARAMVIEVAGFPPFRAEWTWYDAPTFCGDEPVNLWLDLRWLLAYLAPGSNWRTVKGVAMATASALAEAGLSELHVRMRQGRGRFREADSRSSDWDAEEQEGFAAGSYSVSVVALFFALEELMTVRRWRRKGSTLTTFEHVRACFAALWGWPLSGEKPVSVTCFRCELSKVTLLLDGLVVDSATLAESDTPGVGPKAARNRAVRTHRIRRRCFSVRYWFVPLFLCFSIRRKARTIIRRNARAWLLLIFSFSTRRKARRIIRRNARASMRRTARSRIYGFTHGAFDVSFLARCSQDQLLHFRRRRAFARHVVPLA